MPTALRYGQPVSLSEISQKRRDFGTALRFDGSTTYATLGTGNPFTGSFYISMRLKWFGPTATYQHILSKRTSYGASTMMFDLAINTPGTSNEFIFDTGNVTLSTGCVPPTGIWSHLCWVHDESVNYESLYLNCQREYITTKRTLGTGTTAPIVLGGVDTPKAEFFYGEQDEVVIGIGNPSWRDVVAMDAKSKFTSDSESDGIYAPWTLLNCDEGSGTTLIDSSGNGNGGTLVNTTYSSNVFMKTA